MTANTPPKPHTEGMEWTNEETGIKYQFSGGAWRAVSSSASEEVAEAIDNIDLEKVLGNGNIADKDIVLTDGVDDLIDISPTEGRIIIASDADAKTPKLTLAHFGDHDEGNRKAEIELDENGTRLDFEMSGEVKDVHFRFGDDEKLIINHEGDAEFTGKVKAAPGTAGNEVVTYQQLAELDQEIEDIRPSIDRGEWTYTPGDASVATGQYIAYKIRIDGTYCNELYAACILAAGDDADAKSECNRKYTECGIAADNNDPDFNANWEYCDFIKLHKTDVNGRLHTFSDAEGGMYVEIFNNDGSGFGLFQIIPNGVTGSVGQVIGMYVTHVHSEGTPNGNARVKMFEMASANPADYVSKDGDSMMGALNIRGYTSDSAPSLVLRPQDSNGSNSDVLKVYGTDGHGKFWVTLGGDISASSSWSPTKDRHLATKEYVDSLVVNGPARLAWRWLGDKSSSTTPDDGGFYNNGGYLRFSFKTDNSVDLGLSPFPDTGFVTSQYGPIGTIWHYDKSVNKWQLMRQLRIDGFRWNYNDHIEYKLSSSHGRSFDELIIGEPYYITIGGWF